MTGQSDLHILAVALRGQAELFERLGSLSLAAALRARADSLQSASEPLAIEEYRAAAGG